MSSRRNPARAYVVVWFRDESSGETMVLKGEKRRSTRQRSRELPQTGGEDIDYCIRLLSDGASSLVGAPTAAVDHAWWSDGHAHLQRWAEGDGALFDLHPQYTYRDVPDAAESAALLSAAALALGLSPAVGLVPVWIFLVEAALFYFTHSASPRFGMSSLSPLQKAVVAWHAALILVRASFGRMCGHWHRGGIVGASPCWASIRLVCRIRSQLRPHHATRIDGAVCSIHASHSAAFDHLLKRNFDN